MCERVTVVRVSFNKLYNVTMSATMNITIIYNIHIAVLFTDFWFSIFYARQS